MVENVCGSLLALMEVERNAQVFPRGGGGMWPLNVRLEFIRNTTKEMAMAWKGVLEEEDLCGSWVREQQMNIL